LGAGRNGGGMYRLPLPSRGRLGSTRRRGSTGAPGAVGLSGMRGGTVGCPGRGGVPGRGTPGTPRGPSSSAGWTGARGGAGGRGGRTMPARAASAAVAGRSAAGCWNPGYCTPGCWAAAGTSTAAGSPGAAGAAGAAGGSSAPPTLMPVGAPGLKGVAGGRKRGAAGCASSAPACSVVWRRRCGGRTRRALAPLAGACSADTSYSSASRCSWSSCCLRRASRSLPRLSRKRAASGASTVDECDRASTPSSVRRRMTSLFGSPVSLASS